MMLPNRKSKNDPYDRDDDEFEPNTSTNVTWVKPFDTTTGWETNIRKREVGGKPPALKLNDFIKFKSLKGKTVNAKIKSINTDGYVDVIANGKNYLCVWKYNHWEEKK